MQLKLIDWEKDFDSTKVITDPSAIDPKKKKFTENGIFSERIFGRGDASSTVYECKCGARQGSFLSREICPICHSPVENKGSSIEVKGWIDLGKYYIIKPFFYRQMENIVTKKALEGICQYDPRLTVDGIVEKSNGYQNVGLTYFREHFEEILKSLYENSKKDKADEAYNLIMKYHKKGQVWVNKHPVYSSVLRPAILIDKNFSYAEENKFFCQIIKNIGILNDKSDIERTKLADEPLLWEVQEKCNLIYETVINSLSGKTGLIRLRLLGNRVNFSARTVIVPNGIGRKINQIEYPYLAAVELFKYEIINILSKKYNSFKEAIQRWYESTLHFSREVYDVLVELKNKTVLGLKMILNRNPTIELGSILETEIAEIKRDYDDLTLGVHNFILAFIAGDYDGDVLTTISLKDNSFKRWMFPFDPNNLLISNDNGLFNRKFSFSKDYKFGAELLLSKGI